MENDDGDYIKIVLTEVERRMKENKDQDFDMTVDQVEDDLAGLSLVAAFEACKQKKQQEEQNKNHPPPVGGEEEKTETLIGTIRGVINSLLPKDQPTEEETRRFNQHYKRMGQICSNESVFPIYLIVMNKIKAGKKLEKQEEVLAISLRAAGYLVNIATLWGLTLDGEFVRVYANSYRPDLILSA